MRCKSTQGSCVWMGKTKSSSDHRSKQCSGCACEKFAYIAVVLCILTTVFFGSWAGAAVLNLLDDMVVVFALRAGVAIPGEGVELTAVVEGA